MFSSRISTLTDAEIAADIATCRTVIATGHVNGILLDGDSEQYYRDWLECAEEEQTIRADDTRATAPLDMEVVAFFRDARLRKASVRRAA